MTWDPTLRRLMEAIPLLAERPASEWRVNRLPGLTNRNWRLVAGDRDLVLRAPGQSAQRYLSRGQELHNAQLAAELGVAPPILYSDPETGVTLQHFLRDARALTQVDLTRPETARAVGAVLGRLHHSNRPFRGTMAPFPIIDRYLMLAADDRLRRLRGETAPIERALERSKPTAVPSHIDPNPANFLLLPDGTLKMIDWEFSAMCEPAWDLAAVAAEGEMSPDAQAALHEGYGLRPDADTLSRLWLMRTALHLVAASWTLAELAGGNDATGLRELLETHCAALARRLADPLLAVHLERAA